MKISGRRIDGFVRAPDEGVRAALLFGPDEGLVRERAVALVTAIAEDASDPFRVVEISASQIERDQAILGDEVAAISMMGGRRAIRVRGANDGLGRTFAEFLDAPLGDGFVVVEAGELASRSSLRRTFEQADNAAALPCYADEGAVLGDFIRETLAQLKIDADHEAIMFLESSSGSDRQLTRRELEKLALYVGSDGGRLDIVTARACVGDTSAMALEDVAYAAGSGDQVGLDRALRRYFSEGGSAVGVLRVVASHIVKLQRVVGMIEQGTTLDAAISGLKPPIFFKRRDDFRGQADKWDLARLNKAKKIVSESEIKCKTTGIPDHTVCARALMQVAAAAPRARR